MKIRIKDGAYEVEIYDEDLEEKPCTICGKPADSGILFANSAKNPRTGEYGDFHLCKKCFETGTIYS